MRVRLKLHEAGFDSVLPLEEVLDLVKWQRAPAETMACCALIVQTSRVLRRVASGALTREETFRQASLGLELLELLREVACEEIERPMRDARNRAAEEQGQELAGEGV